MNLGDILKEATFRNLVANGSQDYVYQELHIADKFEIRFLSKKFPEVTMTCSVPYTGKEEEENYLRVYFLSMLFNAAIHGMKRMKKIKKGKN